MIHAQSAAEAAVMTAGPGFLGRIYTAARWLQPCDPRRTARNVHDANTGKGASLHHLHPPRHLEREIENRLKMSSEELGTEVQPLLSKGLMAAIWRLAHSRASMQP